MFPVAQRPGGQCVVHGHVGLGSSSPLGWPYLDTGTPVQGHIDGRYPRRVGGGDREAVRRGSGEGRTIRDAEDDRGRRQVDPEGDALGLLHIPGHIHRVVLNGVLPRARKDEGGAVPGPRAALARQGIPGAGHPARIVRGDQGEGHDRAVPSRGGDVARQDGLRHWGLGVDADLLLLDRPGKPRSAHGVEREHMHPISGDRNRGPRLPVASVHAPVGGGDPARPSGHVQREGDGARGVPAGENVRSGRGVDGVDRDLEGRDRAGDPGVARGLRGEGGDPVRTDEEGPRIEGPVPTVHLVLDRGRPAHGGARRQIDRGRAGEPSLVAQGTGEVELDRGGSTRDLHRLDLSRLDQARPAHGIEGERVDPVTRNGDIASRDPARPIDAIERGGDPAGPSGRDQREMDRGGGVPAGLHVRGSGGNGGVDAHVSGDRGPRHSGTRDGVAGDGPDPVGGERHGTRIGHPPGAEVDVERLDPARATRGGKGDRDRPGVPGAAPQLARELEGRARGQGIDRGPRLGPREGALVAGVVHSDRGELIRPCARRGEGDRAGGEGASRDERPNASRGVAPVEGDRFHSAARVVRGPVEGEGERAFHGRERVDVAGRCGRVHQETPGGGPSARRTRNRHCLHMPIVGSFGQRPDPQSGRGQPSHGPCPGSEAGARG